MILVGLGIAIALIVVGVILDNNGTWGGDLACYIIGSLLLVVVFVGGFCTIDGLIDAKTADERLVMYEEENARIEEQVASVVTQYQKYETDIFTEVKPESAMTLVSLYPELKSDALVQSQIELYTANNEKIKELREEKIQAKVYRWWLYFGG